MNTYARPNRIDSLFDTLTEAIDPLLSPGNPPALTDPGIEELLAALSDAVTAALRATRDTAAPAPAPAARTAPARTTAARVTTTQVGSVAGEPKPGSLRARLIDYLAAHPGEAFTVTQLSHAVDATSGGAVGAALNTMTAHGEAIQTTDSPKRYTAPAGAAPAPAAPPADTEPDDADTDPDDDELDLDDAEEAATQDEATADTDTADEASEQTAQVPDPDTAPAPEKANTAPAPKARAARGRAKATARPAA